MFFSLDLKAEMEGESLSTVMEKQVTPDCVSFLPSYVSNGLHRSFTDDSEPNILTLCQESV